jgi:hypothetical protein
MIGERFGIIPLIGFLQDSITISSKEDLIAMEMSELKTLWNENLITP